MIWLTSYPKSGNTWVRILFALAKYGDAVDLEKLVGSLTEYSPWEADRKWFDQVSGKDWSTMNGGTILACRVRAQAALEAAHGADALVKSHNIAASIKGVALFPAGESHRAVHIVRNPLDVAVSLKHHMGMEEEVVIRIMTNPDMMARRTKTCAWEKYGSWRAHTESWLNHAPYPTFHMRYEDLVAHKVDVLAKAFAHTGINISADQVQGLLNGTAIADLQAAEDKVGFDEIPSALTNFFRKGGTGAWKEELTAEARKTLLADCQPLMDHFGFEY